MTIHTLNWRWRFNLKLEPNVIMHFWDPRKQKIKIKKRKYKKLKEMLEKKIHTSWKKYENAQEISKRLFEED
jgi:hypothetical protein